MAESGGGLGRERRPHDRGRLAAQLKRADAGILVRQSRQTRGEADRVEGDFLGWLRAGQGSTRVVEAP